MAEAEHSVLEVAKLQVATLGLGHGAPLVGNARRYIEAVAQRLISKGARASDVLTG
jgi:hypothetical protein